MKVVKTKFKGLIYFKDFTYSDKRGSLKEIFTKEKINKRFDLHIISQSKKNVIRGLHFQIKKPQAKFITVISGKIFDVVVDLRKKSKTFGKKFEIILDSKNNECLYIPEGFAHGFLALTDEAEFLYKTTDFYNKESERSIHWKKNDFNIKWPSLESIFLSKKDQ